ncbi:hypothetical protein PsYK624_099870 [Phanerochaete sordida]|uniref:Uncharacterized protein n=1 Tax=Phanerochaete sordida TaxID=48140 RepID=A0A9P3LGI7_9APHY|nr:hypothetical protein PsYK624_099870 [Phanerochaete sordida]
MTACMIFLTSELGTSRQDRSLWLNCFIEDFAQLDRKNSCGTHEVLQSQHTGLEIPYQAKLLHMLASTPDFDGAVSPSGGALRPSTR